MRLAQYIAQVHTSESTGHEQSRANSVKAHTMRLNARENCGLDCSHKTCTFGQNQAVPPSCIMSGTHHNQAGHSLKHVHIATQIPSNVGVRAMSLIVPNTVPTICTVQKVGGVMHTA